MKKLRYNADHPRPQLGSGIGVGDLPRTIDKDVPPLVERDDMPIRVEGSKYYSMGECSVVHRIIPEGDDPFPGHHLSISHPDRYPTWDEVAEARYRLIPDEAYMFMPLPPSEGYLNIHPYMFNLQELKYIISTEAVQDVTGKTIGIQRVRIDLKEPTREIVPVFGLMKSEPGTTMVHATREEDDEDCWVGTKTLCGKDCSEWYGDDDMTLEDVECKLCQRALKQS